MGVKQCRGGVRLRVWLREQNLTQAAFARQIRASQQNLSAWLRGRPLPLDKAVAIEKTTGIPVEDWLVAADPLSAAGG